MSTSRQRQTENDNTNERIVGGYWPNWVLSPIRIRDINSNYNLVYLFHAQPVGGPPGTTGEIYFTPPDDGRGARTNFKDDIQYASNCSESVVALYDQFGGFDGLDWNTFEADQAPDTDEMNYMTIDQTVGTWKELRSEYPTLRGGFD